MIFIVLLAGLQLVHSQSQCSSTSLGNCPSLNTVDRPMFAEYLSRPVFLSFATNTSRYNGVDSVCYTVDCLPDGSGTYVVYAVTVYSDRSIQVTSAIQSPTTPGLYTFSSAASYELQYSLGTAGCGVNVAYGCDVCGQTSEQFGFGTSNTYGPISSACLSQATSILAVQGLDSSDITVLPMELGPQCYYSTCTNCYQSASSCT